VDCDWVRSGLVDWHQLRAHVQLADEAWQPEAQKPQEACDGLAEGGGGADASVVLARAADAAAECALGAASVLLLLLVCTSDCGAGGPGGAVAAFEGAWRGALGGPAGLPVYMLGTSSWPVASLLAKWQGAACGPSPAPRPERPEQPGDILCQRQETLGFTSAVQAATDEYLLPLLWSWEERAPTADLALGRFMLTVMQPLTTFMNSGFAESPQMAAGCGGVAAALAALLLLLRLMGPPVTRDPLHGARLLEFGALVVPLQLHELLWATPRALAAVLATSRHLTWRSHRLFWHVPLSEVRWALQRGAAELAAQPVEGGGGAGAESWPTGGLLEALHEDTAARGRVWSAAAASTDVGPLWGQISRWLLSGEPVGGASLGLTYLTMGFGPIDGLWLRGFLGRALDAGLPRLIFVTPDRAWLLVCEELVRERDAAQRILCMRVFTHFARPYDLNNEAKFHLFPILLSLGVDVVWLDIDIFVFKDPTRRLLEQRGQDPANPKDVLVTDHFDEHCLNHGVFTVRASDRSLLWMLEYIKWLQWYPYGHDQNGWDAFLGHSIVEPQLPDNLRSNPAINVSYGILNTELEYVTLTGWAGARHQWRRALLLHFTTTQGITGRAKKQRLMALFNATGRRPGEAEPDRRRLQMATWKVLMRLRTDLPMWKRPCYEGIHSAIGQLLTSGIYEEVLA